VTAAGGWGFMADMGGDHGALRPELLRVPLLISGPRVDPEGALEGARLIDLFPTVLELVGLGGVYPAEMVDGRALEVLTAATGDSG
jgi:arylsulfatase A-like enzyme